MPAINLEQAIRAFHPAPLSGNDLKLYYVERPYSPLKRIEIQLRHQRRLKAILVGHRGAGKSTALNCLCANLDDAFIPVSVSVQKDMSAYDVHYVDILLAMSARLLQRATDEGAMPRPLTSVICEDLLDNILRWFEKTIEGLQFAPRSGAKSLQAQVNLWAIQLQAKLKDEADTRLALRERVGMRLADLLDRMNWVIGEMERHSNKQVLFVVEDIDKLDIEKVRNLFLGYGRSLTAPIASIIYTFPAGLRYTTDWPFISQNYFGWYAMLPNVALQTRAGEPLPSGRRVLEQIVYRRLNKELVTPNALRMLIADSGGLVGTLIHLMLIAVTSPML